MHRRKNWPTACAWSIAAVVRSIRSSRWRRGPKPTRSTTANARCCALRAKGRAPARSRTNSTSRTAPCAIICPKQSASSASPTGSKPIDWPGKKVGCSHGAYNVALFLPIASALKKSDFHYDLPTELIAQQPLPERSASRLLVADAPHQSLADRSFHDLPALIQPGDLLVFNDTRVLPARLFGHKQSGGAVEIMLERITGTHTAVAMLGVSKKPRDGSLIELDDGTPVRVLGREGQFFELRFECTEPLEKLLLRVDRKSVV